jgi:hypothetical protein
MAVQDGYGKSSGSESLVFAYDLKDTINSYRGEPTTNICNNADFSTPISGTAGGSFGGWTFGSWSSTNTHETVTDTYNGQTINALKITLGDYPAHFFSSNWAEGTTTGVTYTWSNLLKGTPGQVVNMFSHWGNIKTVTLTGEWQRYSGTFVRGGTPGNYMYYNPNHSTTGNVIYVAQVQVEQKSHATPFTISSRSNTQGLLDLTGNSSVDLSNVSFDSNAQLTFDGTNDVTYSGNLPQLDTFSLEVVLKPSALSGWFLYRNTNMNYIDNNDNFQFGFSANKLYGAVEYHPTGDDRSVISTTVLNTGEYVHGVLVHDNSTLTLRIYVNGNLEGTTVSTGQSYPYRSTNKMSIGADGGSNHGGISGNKYYYSGDINVVKVYNRVLTSTEITNNYLKYKRQYGLT